MSDYETERSAEAEKRYARRLGSCLKLRREFEAGADWSRERGRELAREILTECQSEKPDWQNINMIMELIRREYGIEL